MNNSISSEPLVITPETLAALPTCVAALIIDYSLDGARQEPWPPDERPADCLSEEALRALLHQEGENF